MAYNINSAVSALVRNSQASSLHMCAKYVRMAMEAGGLNTSGRPGSACQYITYLPTIGYNKIGEIYGKSEQSNWSSTQAQQGDIAVMEHGVHGHICMWSGNQWISDFRQNNMWVYGGDGKCYIFRYNGEIDNTLSQGGIPSLVMTGSGISTFNNQPRPIMASRGENTVYRLSESSNDKRNVSKIGSDRNNRFKNMTDGFVNEMPELGRDVIISSESYGSEIIKNGQESKTK